MYIKATDGSFHKITGIMMNEFQTTVNIQTDEIDPALPDATQNFTVPESALTGKTDEDVVAWLTGPDGPYTDGEFLLTSEYDLSKAQSIKYAEIKARRIELEEGGLQTSFGVADSDPDSQRKISGGVQMAMISLHNTLGPVAFPDGLEIVWRFQDNSTVPLDASQMIQMGVEVGKQVAQYQMVKNYFDAQVAAATTIADVETIDVQVNWLAIDPSA